MPLDEATRRSIFIHQHEVKRLVERERARVERGEEVHYDTGSRMATWETRLGEIIGRWYGEIVASYLVRDRILRWAWAGRSSVSSVTHAEVVAREGQARGVPQLTMSIVGELDEEEASMLARLGVLVAGGAGMKIERGEEEITFVGLFDSPRPRDGEILDPSRYSVPPPPVTRSSAPPPRPPSNPPAAYRSMPPIREIYGPRSARGTRSTPPPPPPREVREPARSILLPVATGVLNVLARSVPGFQQALFVITVDREAPLASERQGLGVFLVANESSSQLRAVDLPTDLVEAAARLVDADRNDGNGPWRKLSARIVPKADGGATLQVDVL
jgi:hypothetical protein